MKNPLRYLCAAITLMALLIGLGLPVIASISDGPTSAVKVSRSSKGHGGAPWDPGDERAPYKDITISDSAAIDPDMLIARKSDDPWDPGDESDRKLGGVSWLA